MKKKVHQIVDVTGILLIPGNNGDDCLGNGEHIDENRNDIECCCDECNYYLQCFPEFEKSIKENANFQFEKVPKGKFNVK